MGFSSKQVTSPVAQNAEKTKVQRALGNQKLRIDIERNLDTEL